MNKNYFIFLIAALLFLGLVGFQILDKSTKNQERQAPLVSESVTTLEAQTNNDGPVAVTVLPRKFASPGVWEFEISLETHSVELNEDLVKSAVLIADNRNYYPVAWDGGPAGGHHRRGILKFEALPLSSDRITLKIFNVGGMSERIFNWDLKDKDTIKDIPQS